MIPIQKDVYKNHAVKHKKRYFISKIAAFYAFFFVINE